MTPVTMKNNNYVEWILVLAAVSAVCYTYSDIDESEEDAGDGNSTSVKFIIIGDWGGQETRPFTTHGQLAVAAGMAKTAKQHNIDFILALGDNFYDHGVKSVHDPRFKQTFERVYSDPALVKIPWYLAAGNADMEGDIDAQFQYSQISTRWKFDYNFYIQSFHIPNSNAMFDVIMIDTVSLCGNGTDDEPSDAVDDAFSDNMYVWLETKLAESTAKYVFTAGHYPVYSIGKHGPNKCMQDRVLPLLIKYNVTAHFSGHEHNLQHINVNQNNTEIEFIVSGAGSRVNPDESNLHSVPPSSLRFKYADVSTHGGYCLATVTKNQLTFTFMKANGQTVYEFHKHNN